MKRLISILPQRNKFILGIIFVVGLTATEIASSYSVKRLTDAATAATKDFKAFYFALGLLIVITIFELIFTYCRTRLLGRYSESGLKFLRHKLAQKYNRLEIKSLTTHHSGDYVSRATNDANKVQSFLSDTLPGLVWNPLTFLGALSYLLILSWKLTLVSICIIPLVFLFIGLLSKPISKLSHRLQEKLGSSNSLVQDYIKGVEVSKAYNLEEHLENNYDKVIDDSVHFGKKIAKQKAFINSFSNFFSILPFFITFFVGGYFVINHDMSMGDLLAFIILLNYISNPIFSFPRLFSEYKVQIAAVKRIFEVLDLEDERMDGTDYLLEDKENVIEFKDVHFTYPNKTEGVINHLSMTIKKGESVALVGPSGGGKSTIIQLLLGYYDGYEGHILITGHELKSWNLKRLRDHLALVSQDTYLFPESIEENISYGNFTKEVTHEEIVEAAKLANAYDFIESFENKFDTQIGELGNRLSGGQKQRIAIARAIIKDASILLLDEATSALDNESEQIVQDAINHLMKNKTSVVIAHRLSTIKNVDRILVIDKGHIAEMGSHDELMERDGIYKDLYLKQMKMDDKDEVVE